MMQSGRGPGVIGMMMALVVLIGFGLLFMFAFDEGMQGADQSIETLIRNQGKEIESCNARITEGEKALAKTPALLATSKELGRIKRENQAFTSRIATLKQAIDAAKTDLVARKQALETYKDEYRAFVRGKAKGETLAQLETKSGEVYKNVFIREVTPIGIQIRHDEGQKRIPFEVLPDAMVDYYQFDADQKAAALKIEIAAINNHEAAALVANDQADQAMAQQRAKEAQERKEKTLLAIAEKQALVETIRDEIKGLENDLERAAAAAAAARSAGNMHMNKSGSISANIRSKQGRISALLSEISQMSSSVR